MTHLLTAAKLSVSLIERRDDMRRILGPKYEIEVAEVRAILRSLTRENGKPITDNALEVAREMSAAGHDPSLLIAAMVDECEASA